MQIRFLAALGAAFIFFPAHSWAGGNNDTAKGVTAVTSSIDNGFPWKDTAGNSIHAHGGGFLKVRDTWYWFGENRNPNYSFKEVSCYRSKDLIHWEYRGSALSPAASPDLEGTNVERPKVIYNESTKQYVMWMHWENGKGYGEARAAVATSPTVEGPYTWRGSFRPYADSGVMDHGRPGYMSRDCNLFVDDDGTAYFISSSNENADLHFYRLTPDYLGIDTLVAKLFPGQKREAPVIFKRDGHYFLITSACTGWAPNQAAYSVADRVGGWAELIPVGDATTFHSQSASLIAVQGTAATSYIYAGDRWAGAWKGPYLDSTYVWMKIEFPTADTMQLNGEDGLSIDVQTGVVASLKSDHPAPVPAPPQPAAP